MHNFYVDSSWHQEEIILKYKRDNFAPAGQFLRYLQSIRRSELAPKELIPRFQRENFVPTEFEIKIGV